MKRHIALMLALSLSAVGMSIASTPRTAEAAGKKQYGWVTGMLKVPQGEVLTITMTDAMVSSVVSLTATTYGRGVCAGDECRYPVASQTTRDPIAVAAGEAVTITLSDLPELEEVSFLIMTSSPSLMVSAERRFYGTDTFTYAVQVRSLGAIRR